MALQLKPKQASKWKTLGVPSAVVAGSVYLILRTFPHLKISLYNYITGKEDEEVDYDYDPIELNSNDESNYAYSSSDNDFNNDDSNDIINESMVDVNQWSNNNLKSWLQEVRN